MFTTYSKAVSKAQRTARRNNKWMYVWSEDLNEYGIGDDIDADTYYAGQQSIACIGPDGEIEYA